MEKYSNSDLFLFLKTIDERTKIDMFDHFFKSQNECGTAPASSIVYKCISGIDVGYIHKYNL